MENPKVSIVIPVYNGADLLRQAIDSALNQTYENCEVIVVNDGSTDDSDAICKSYSSAIRYFSKQNGGVSTAFNRGVYEMTGDYFSLFTHDDIYYPSKIEMQVRALHKSGNMKAPCFGNYDIVDSFTNKVSTCGVDSSYDSSLLCDSVYGLLYGAVNSVTVLLHRDYFDKQGHFNEHQRTTQDYDMWFRAFRNQRCVYIDKPLIKWRHHSGQDSVTNHAHIANQEKLHLSFYESLTESEIKRMFGSRYQFHYEMMQFNKLAKFDKCAKYNSKALRDLHEPERAKEMRQGLRKWILSWGTNKPQRIVIFGAGVNGQRAQTALRHRGINVDLFIDNHPKQEFVNGVRCEKPSKGAIENGVVIIAAEGFEDSFRSQLLELGSSNWLLLCELNKKLRQIPPISVLVEEVT